MVENVPWKKIQEISTELEKKVNQDPWRLSYHLMPKTGWLNDPNGLCQFNGVVHFYHQYVPHTPGDAGATFWGHKTSSDFVHFKEEEIFLAPEHDYNKSGAYSGSAIVVGDEIHYFYTGNVKEEGDYDYLYEGRKQHTIHLVSKDGFTIEKEEIVIPHESYPKGFTTHIRDPKVFSHQGMYYMILGGRTVDHEGKILIYASEDLSHWTYKGIFFGDEYQLGYMWECPDYFQINGKDVLVFSPQGLAAKETQFQNMYQSGYLVGKIDWENLKFKETSSFEELDYGFDFYAPQTFEDEKKRRILWGWMGMGQTSPEYLNPTVSRGWQHAATLPRQLSLKENKLIQQPLVEYEMLRKKEKKQLFQLTKEKQTFLFKERSYELLIESEEVLEKLEVELMEDTHLSYDGTTFTLAHWVSGYGRKSRKVMISSLKEIRIFVDHSSIEIFLNGGEKVLSSRVYPKVLRDTLTFAGSGKINVTAWQLEK